MDDAIDAIARISLCHFCLLHRIPRVFLPLALGTESTAMHDSSPAEGGREVS